MAEGGVTQTRPAAAGKPARLRVGVLLDDWEGPQWLRGLLDRLRASRVAEVVLVVKNPAPPRHGLGDVLAGGGQSLLFHLYTRLDDLVFRRRAAEDVLGPTDLRPALRGATIVEAEAQGGELAGAALDAFAGAGLDVLLQFGFAGLSGRALDVARHGVWSYDHAMDAGLDGLWEVLDGEPTTVSTLRARGPGGAAERVLYRSWSATDHHSLARSRQNRYAKSAEFVLRKLSELQRGAAAGVPEDEAPPLRTPGNLELAGRLARLGARFARDKWMQWRGLEQWVLAYDRSGGPAHHGVVPGQLEYLVPPADRFWADPFPVEHDGGWYLFFEEYEQGSRRGRIAMLRLGRDGSRSAPEPVLEGASHYSYPCVFRWKQHWLMIPETSARRTVELYRATRFPDRWERCGTPISGVRAVDTTIAEIDGRWWLFTCMAEEGALAYDELFLFHADSPFGPFTPHRKNPVISDVRSARPAGRLYHDGVAWHRPAQDCAARYGYATVINRIDRLTPDEYAETTVARIEPDWDPRIVATHTFNRAGNLTIVDALRLR